MPSKPMIARAKRGPYDELYTPAEAIRYLLPHIPTGTIWESAPGKGNIVKLLQRAGHKVVWSVDDYFGWEPPRWDIQITNPPFSIKAKWMNRANQLGKPWALLLPVTALGSRACQLELEECQALFLPRRIDFTGKRAPWFSVAWFCRDFHLPYQMCFVKEPS